MKCNECKFWRALEVQNMHDLVPGHCHRHPPVQIVTGHEGPSAKRDANAWTFPIAYSSSWCGEFKAVE